ncbi:GNAT family N-acetyltransferase [bacterium]|nr:GNAT family N-acetyltransferase [bacterium]
MTPENSPIYPLTKKDMPQAIDVLFDAFGEDPVFNAVFEGASREQRRGLYESTMRYCLRYGEVWASSPNTEGVAGWVRGEKASMTPWRMLVSGAIWSGMKMGPQYSQRMSTVFSPIDADRKVHMAEQSFIYLLMIGVASAHQGQGHGRTLLDAVIRLAEKEQIPVYLETETEKNVQIYEHFGFEVLNKVTLPVIDLPMWEMLRKPA